MRKEGETCNYCMPNLKELLSAPVKDICRGGQACYLLHELGESADKAGERHAPPIERKPPYIK